MTAATARAAMPIGAHLREARRRLGRCLLALVIGCAAGYLLSEEILEVLRAPILELADPRDASLNYETVTAAFDLRVKIALYAGVVLSSPVWLYQLFAFLTPGLTRRERGYTFGFMAAAVPLFVAGCWMGFLLFPRMVELLVDFAPAEDSTLLQASYYVDFVLKIVLAAGIAFVLPVFLVMLNVIGVLPARVIARGWRVGLIAIVAFSALVTPAADALSMFFVAAPMGLLFGAAIVITQVHDRAVAARRGREAVGSPTGERSLPSCSD